MKARTLFQVEYDEYEVAIQVDRNDVWLCLKTPERQHAMLSFHGMLLVPSQQTASSIIFTVVQNFRSKLVGDFRKREKEKGETKDGTECSREAGVAREKGQVSGVGDTGS